MRRAVCCSLALIVVLTGCSSSTDAEFNLTTNLRVPETPVSMDKDDYPVYPDADRGADPSVSAELGGAGFTGDGWTTNTDFDLIGDPHATKGGVLRHWLSDFPATLRTEGPESNTNFNYTVRPLIYESLLGTHPTTLEDIPSLATHWQISDDRMNYRFRINPSARFSDATPVTAQDVVATWDFMMRDDIQSPSNQLVFGRLERPVAESKYIVSVKAKELNWINFLAIAGMPIFPARALEGIDGETYLRDYNYRMLPGTGPYEIRESDINRGNSVTVRRRETPYWAEDHRANIGIGNFDELRFVVVRDQNLAFEMFKKGELDWFFINRASVWVNELNFSEIERGLIQKRMVFNAAPNGVQGLGFNMRNPPFNDIRIRRAFTHLFNRKLMIEKLMFNLYVPQNSYYAGTPYENVDNPKNEYNPELALQLLAEAGWNRRDSQGRLIRNGQPLTVEVLYSTPTSEPFLTIFQEDLRSVGIGLNLRLVTGETLFQLVNERQFEMVSMGWGASVFPVPDVEYHSRLADVDNTNNITGIKDAQLDALMEEYNITFDLDRRVELLRSIDGILANIHPYILEWTAPFQRVVFWNKFGSPPGYFSRIADAYGGINAGPALTHMWWIDPEKERVLAEARRDDSIVLEVGPTEDRYWLDYAERARDESSND